MQQTIICYSLGSIEPKKRTKFNRELYGYEDQSNHGKYKYQRKGILSKIKHEKPLNSVIITSENPQNIIKHLKNYKARYISHKIR